MRQLFIIMLMLTLSGRTLAEKKESAQTDARELFDKVFNMVFGPEGSSFTYSVNIVGLYKTQGDAVYKDKKITYNESRFAAWEDGKVALNQADSDEFLLSFNGKELKPFKKRAGTQLYELQPSLVRFGANEVTVKAKGKNRRGQTAKFGNVAVEVSYPKPAAKEPAK